MANSEEFESEEHRDAEGIVACSPVTGQLYLVYRWEDRGGSKVVSKDKRVLEREDVSVLASVERVHDAARMAYENRVGA